jgi:hypothetical protein
MLCPSCASPNDDAAEVCFHCRAVLSAVTRGSLIAGRYRILDPLGRGGMGAVYRARDEVLDDEVALKILRPEVAGTPEMAARFRSEIKLARKVSHWNVCRIHEYGEDGGLQYISMELVSGSTLKDRLRARPLAAAEAFDVAIQIADGLAAVHKVGIVHRDLKSPNVMIDAQGTAKVMDFGIAKAAGPATDPGASTGYVLGSPEYMSPEQARGRRADFRSDLYSLGVVVFEAFTGRVPFRGTTPVATLMMHVEAPPPIDDPSLALPPSLVPVLRKALAKEPGERFADAASMAAALRASAEDGSRVVAPSGAPSPSTDASRTEVVHTRPIVRGAGSGRLAVLGLAVAAASVLVLLRRGDIPAPAAPAPPATVSLAPAPIVSVSPAVLEPEPTVTTTLVRAAAVTPSPTASLVPSVPPPTTLAVLPPPVPLSPVAPPPSPTAAATPAPSIAPAQGFLLVLATPWADVSVDGRAVGMTPMAQIPLAPGSHGIVLSHPEYQPFTRKVEVRPGEVTRIRFDFSQDGIKRR